MNGDRRWPGGGGFGGGGDRRTPGGGFGGVPTPLGGGGGAGTRAPGPGEFVSRLPGQPVAGGAGTALGHGPAPAPVRTEFAPVQAPQVNLPKGGGAIRGIGETFQANAFTGTGATTVPLASTPGRDGFGPSLSLSYDSGAGNGPFGIGWHLSVSSIGRRTEKGLPTYGDGTDSDVFVLTGAEELTPTLVESGGNWSREVVTAGGEKRERFRPRVEAPGAFSRIERRTDLTTFNVYWVVTTPANVKHVYGKSEDARVADPANDKHVFQWLLERSEDGRGNVCTYEYKADDLDNVPASCWETNRRNGLAPVTNRYLKRVQYLNATPDDDETCKVEVVLDYGEHGAETPVLAEDVTWPVREDPFSTYRAGFEVRTYRLCRRVLVFHKFEELGTTPAVVRSTELTYDEQPHLTRLVAVQQKGWVRDEQGAYTTESLPPVELAYSSGELQTTVKDVAPVTAAHLRGGVPGANRQWIDLDGDGLPGVLTAHEASLYYQQNLGDAELSPPAPLGTRPSVAARGIGAGSNVQLMDLDGDGRLEMASLAQPGAGYATRRPPKPIRAGDGKVVRGALGQGAWENFRGFQSLPNLDFRDPNVRFIDLTGDGLQDILVNDRNGFTWYPSLGRDGWGTPYHFVRHDNEERGPIRIFGDDRMGVFFADMTGDGQADLVRVENMRVCYWPNLGHGKFGAKVTMGGSPSPIARHGEFNPARLRMADVDGSGTADLLYVAADEVRLWRNQSGNRFGARETVPGMGGDDLTAASVQVVDLLGTGTATIVRSSPLPDAHPVVRYVELTGGVKPHLLTEVNNNLGLTTRVQYAPSTKFFLEDRAAGRPWPLRLPFPVQVIERVEIYDAIRRVRLASTYSYHHGHYDGREREFRGFGMVEQKDAVSISELEGKGLFPDRPPAENGEYPLPPTLTKTWFHTGFWASERARAMEQYEAEYWKGDATQARLPAPAFPANMPSAREVIQAHRALRGSVLRTEVYTLDDAEAAEHPYAVAEKTYEVRRLQPEKYFQYAVGVAWSRPADEPIAPAVFVAVEREAVESRYERDPDDPRVVHGLVLDADAFGFVRKTGSIAYPRRAPDTNVPEQGAITLTCSESTLAHVTTEDDAWRLGVPLVAKDYELTGVEYEAGAGGAANLYAWQVVADAVANATVIPYEQAPSTSQPPPVEKRQIGQEKTRYWDSTTLATTPAPLDFGEVDAMALPYETYRHAQSDGILDGAFGSGRVTEQMLQDGGYVHPETGDDDWWIPTGRATPVPADFYRPEVVADAFGNETLVTYDAYKLLVTEVEDPAGNVVQATGLDYHVLDRTETTDANGNRSAVAFDALGRVTATAVMGKTGGSDGDTLEDPTTSFEYQVFRWKDEQKPNYVHVLERELHGEANERFQEQYVYSDGAGNVVMTKKKVEPGDAPERDSNGALVYDTEGNLVVSPADPRWVGSGRTVLDNKGNPVKKYEPFFSATHEYEDDEDLVQWGVTPVLRYDPLGRLVRTEFPDGTIARLTFDPWRVESWDQNDTVLDPDCEWFAIRDEDAEPPPDPFPSDEDARAANLSEAHAGTPAVAHLDPLGRVVLAVQDNGSAGTYETRVAYDVEGNALEVTDARGNAATQTTYGPGGTALHHVSNDAGERFSLPDVLGAAHRSWDQRGHEVRVLKDALRRPTHEFVAEGSLGTGIEILRLRTFYGEGVTDAVDFNLRGRVYAVFHGAGLSVHENFDFKGNLSEKRTRIVADDTAEPEWDAIDTSTPDDAEGDASSLLESESFTETTTYDALNRAVSANTPDDSERKPTYNDAGLLEMVEARLRDASTWTSFVTAIDYDAHGRRVRVDYDSGVVTEYTYDPLSFRLVRALTTRPAPNAATLLDLRFWYDAVGNVVEIHNDAEDTVYFDNQQVTPNQLFEYDALYRLVSATGREHATTLNDSERDHQELPYGNMPQNGTALRTYTETYTYDEVGNFLSFHHDGGTGATWTRNYGIETTTNRLLGSGPETEAPWSSEYDHDEHGNMTSMPHLAAKIWNTRDQLREVDLGGGGTAYYLYDAAGQRVRKRIVHNGSTVDERLYLGAWERYRRTVNSTLDTERETLHVADDARRIALVETLTVDEGSTVSSPTPRTRMQHDNHLGTALLELTDDGSVISYEEYHPYGTTAYHAADSSIEVSAKRYRYTGKERDDETGLYYHGARYYACWLGRWTATDPLGAHEGVGLYTYCGGSPVILHDPTGQAYVVPLDGPPAPPAPPATPPPAAKEKAAKPAAPGAKGPPPEADPEAPSSAKPATTAGKPGKAAAPKKSAKSPAGPPKAETALPAPFGPEYVFEGAPARLPPGETWIKRGGGIPAVGPARLPLPPGAPYAWRMLNPNLQLAVTPEGVRIWSELRTLKDLSVVREEVRYDPKEGAYRTSLVTVVPAPPSADDLEFGPARLTSPEGAAERVDVHDDGTIVLRRESGAVTRFFPDPDDPDHYTYFEDGTWYDIILSEEFFAPLRALE